MIDLATLSERCEVRRLDDSDVDGILALCLENAQYYEYCGAQPTREQVLGDLRLAPPGIAPSDKYYIGFFRGDTLIAVMDLIDGYPEPYAAYIGFFMMKKSLQGRNLGSQIIVETAARLKAWGKTSILLAIDKGNPQSTHFWEKNGFVVVRQVDRDGWTALVAKKTL